MPWKPMHGAANPRYRGGLTFDSTEGRWRITCRDGSKELYARAVMAAHIGRELLPGEQVHHINGDRADDRIENLQLLDAREHGALHGREAWKQRKAAWQYAWSSRNACCVSCETTERKHQGSGLCVRCYSREAVRRRRSRLEEVA